MQGKILPFPLAKYAKVKGHEISPRAISAVKLLWISLADFYNDGTHQCNPSIKTLSGCIEKSESQTTVHMNTLKKLGLVIAISNAKGGRCTPNYSIHIPSQPVDRTANTLGDNSPPIISHPVSTTERTYQPVGSPLLDRTQTLIDPLDEILIKKLVKEKISHQKQIELTRLGNKYKIRITANTPLHELQEHLLKLVNHSHP